MRFLKLFPLLAMSILLLTSCGGKNYAQELENQIKSMGGASAELGSVEYTISKIIAVYHDVFYKIGERRILFSSLSTMKAGVDLSLFCAKGESITQIDADKTLASVRRADSGGDISISGNKKIRSLEKEFDTVFGLYAQVCYTNAEGSRYYTSGSKDDMTLAAFNAECEKNGCKKGVSR